jgi:UDP-glucose 4-epimerase
VNLLECARTIGVRKVIYASTGGAVYGEPSYLPCDEEHNVAPLCQYGVSKFTVELYLQLYARLFGLDFTILRYPNVFGPRQDPNGEAGVVAIFIGQMQAGLPVTIFGDGLQSRDFVYVGDVARATILALKAGSRSVINLGSGTGTTVSQIYETLAEIVGYDQQPVYAPTRLGEVYQIYLSGDRARVELGWVPQTTLPDALRRTVDSLSAKEHAGQIV